MSPTMRWLRGAALVLAVEGSLFLAYVAADQPLGWVTHFGVGGAVALIGMIVWIAEERRRVPMPGLWVVLGHLAAMFPDVLFVFGIPHHHWMDAFLGHLSCQRVPGHAITWYAVFMVALTWYLTADARLQASLEASRRRRRR